MSLLAGQFDAPFPAVDWQPEVMAALDGRPEHTLERRRDPGRVEAGQGRDGRERRPGTRGVPFVLQ